MKKLITALALGTILINATSCVKKNTIPNQNSTTSINTFSGTMQCMWDSTRMATPNAFLDINTGKVYQWGDASEFASSIDLTWSENSGGSYVLSPNEYRDFYAPSVSRGFQEATTFLNWSQRNSCLISSTSKITVADFNAISTGTGLTAAIGDKLDFTSSEWDFMECTNADFNKIYMVETTTAGVKKRGLIHFKAGQRGNSNYVDFDIKVIK